MTDIVDVARRVQYTGNGTAGPFSFSFQVNANTEIKVYVGSTLKTITTHYTVSLTSSGAGSVSFTSGNHPTSSQTITIVSAVGLARSSVYTTGGPLTATALEADFDTNIMITQQSSQKVDRALAAPEYDATSIDMTLPTKDDRKGKYLAFNSTSGNPEVGPSTTDVTTLASVTSDIATLADLQDGTTTTNGISTLAGISSNITTVAGISSNVTTVAGISSNVTTVAGKASLITSDFATDMSLVTSDFVTDMNLVTSDFITDMNLVTSDFVADMALINSTFVTKMALVTSDFITDMSLVTADFVSDVNTLATSDIVSDLNTLATSDIVSDLNTLATADIVSDLNTLATTDIVSDLNQLATSDFVSDLNAIEAIKANVTTVAGVSSNVTTVAGISSNVTTVAGISANVTTVAGANSNISTVASNISGVNSFAERYRVGSSDPTSSLDEGDLFYNTSTNALKYYNGSSFQSISVVTTGITNGDVPVFNDVSPGGAQSGDYLTIAGTSISGLSPSEVLTNIGGQASLTFGISNTNAVKVDSSSVANGEIARFTANGLESRSTSELASDIGAATTGKAIAMAIVFG